MRTYAVIGYGSLLSHRSLAKTIPDRSFQPVIVKGYKRIFNVLAKNHTDLLNIERKPGHYFNGVLFTVTSDELKKIKLRERPEYSLFKSWAYDFSTNKKISWSSLAVDLHHSLDHFRHQPNRLYFKSCREAAYAISNKFGRTWDETTYLANGEQVNSWVKRNRSYNF